MLQIKLVVVQKGNNRLLLTFTNPETDELVAQGEFTYDGRTDSIGKLVKAILRDMMRLKREQQEDEAEIGEFDTDGLDDDDDDDDGFSMYGIPMPGGNE